MYNMIIFPGLEMQRFGFKPNLLGLIDQIHGDFRQILDLGLAFPSLKWEKRCQQGTGKK